ncbi:hypothetical protein [Kitasatospora sp. NPDC096140]
MAGETDWPVSVSAAPGRFNKLLGCLYHCLRNRTLYDSERAFAQAVALAA